MSVYATPADLTEYATDDPSVVLPEGDAQMRALDRAERDVLRYLGAVGQVGALIVLEALTAYQRDALRRAVCAQAAWRLARGEDDMAGADSDVLTIGSVTLRAERLPRVGWIAEEELAGAGLLRRSGSAAPTPSSVPPDGPV
jgi:hypothetical protein